jgi:hypothetical protein
MADTAGGAGITYQPATRMDAGFLEWRSKKYRQKYRHFSK